MRGSESTAGPHRARLLARMLDSRRVGSDLDIRVDHAIKGLIHALRPSRAQMIGAGAVVVVKDSTLWLLPLITAKAIDVVVDGGPASTLGWLGAAAGALLLLVYPLHMMFIRLYMGAIRRLGADLRNGLTARLQQLSIGYHARTSAAVTQSKVVRDVENIELMFAQAGNPLASAVVVTAGAITMTALSIPQFLPVYVLAIPAAVVVWLALRRRTHARNEELRREMERYSRSVGDMAALLPITRAHGLERVAMDDMARAVDQVRATALRVDMINHHFGSISWVILQMLTAGCLIVAGVLAVTDVLPISAGQVVLLSTYFTTLTGAAMNVLNLMPIIARGRESARSIAEVLEDPDIELNEGRAEVEQVSGALRLDEVTVTYPGDPKPALEGVSLEIPAGCTVAFVGASGSGKSTLVNTVLGFVRPTAGRVLIDGRDMADLDLRSVRRRVAVVPQESVLFEGSIRDNVRYGLPHVSEEDVVTALDQANVADVVALLPDGLDTAVGSRGARLSGGQRQRISIARALIRDPRILVLDEATSALDSESEHRVQEALDRLMAGRTTLIVAHRLSTVTAADLIVVLEGGRICEQGTHAELVEAGGAYARLWALQTRSA